MAAETAMDSRLNQHTPPSSPDLIRRSIFFAKRLDHRVTPP
jgi:hypothetical protein